MAGDATCGPTCISAFCFAVCECVCFPRADRTRTAQPPTAHKPTPTADESQSADADGSGFLPCGGGCPAELIKFNTKYFSRRVQLNADGLDTEH